MKSDASSMFNSAFECYEAIGRLLAENAPEPWEEIVVSFTILAIDDVSREVIWYKPAKGLFRRRKQFFIDDTGFARNFFALAKLTSTPEKGYYKQCDFVLYKNGQYNATFAYD